MVITSTCSANGQFPDQLSLSNGNIATGPFLRPRLSRGSHPRTRRRQVTYRVKFPRTLTISDLNILVEQIGGQETQRNLSLMRQAPQFDSVANLKGAETQQIQLVSGRDHHTCDWGT
jgi:hypothetical protein